VSDPKQAAGNTKIGEPEAFQITVPKPLHEYLTWLARHSMLGRSVPDVAVQILTAAVDAMFRADYHKKDVPRD
jgi:hypothetical protein